MRGADRRQGGHSSLRVLAQRDFGPYFAGNLLSNSGTWFQSIAQSLLIYRITGSTFMVGLVTFAQFAGTILLAPWSGEAADRFDRRRLIIGTQIGAMAVTATLALLAALRLDTVPVVLALALLLGLVTAFGSPAMSAIIPALVSREDLGAAVAMNSVTYNLARAVGPVAGAFVVARFGIPWAFGLNALSFAALIVALLIVRPRPQGAPSPERPRLMESLRLVRDDPHLLALLGVVASVSFALDAVTTLAPAFATTVFRRPDTLAGFLIGAFGAGAVAAAITATGPSETPYRRIAAMLALLGAGMAAYAVLPVLTLAVVALAAGGFGYLAGQTRATTLLQLGVPDHQRGRIMALWSVCFLGSRPIAGLIDGALASVVGVHVAAIVMTLPVFTAAVMMARLSVRQSRGAAGQPAAREAVGGAASHD